MAARIEERATAAGKRYVAIVTLGHGRGAPRITQTETTMAAAKRALLHLERVAAGEIPRREHRLSEVLDGWLASCERAGRPSAETRERYRAVIASLSDGVLKTPMRSLTGEELETELARLARIYSPATVSLAWRVVRLGLTWGERALRTPDPSGACTAPPSGNRRHLTVSTVDLASLVKATYGHPILDPLAPLAFTTGKRRSELLALRRGDVDLRQRTLCIAGSLVWPSGEPWHIKPRTKTLDHPLVDPLPQAAVDHLRALWGDRLVPAGHFVCADEHGGPLNPRTVSATWTRFAARHGFPGVRLHDLRHGFATMALEEGVQLAVVSRMLHHGRTSITTDVYQHVTERLLEQEAAAIDAAVSARMAQA